MKRRPLLLLWLAALLTLMQADSASAQSPFTNGISVGSDMSGAPMAAWQSIDPAGAQASRVSLAPAEPGYSASFAANHAFGNGRWLLDSALDSASQSRLSADSGHIGLTYTLPGSGARLLQATISEGFVSGNGLLLDSGLWPASGGRRSGFSAGLRWVVAPLATLHFTASGVRGPAPLNEQEIGVNSALSPALCLSLGLHAQQSTVGGFLASAAIRWQPRAQSPIAISMEEDISHSYWYEPIFNGASTGAAIPIPLALYSGQRALAMLDATITPTLTLQLGASLNLQGHMNTATPLGPTFIASLSRGL